MTRVPRERQPGFLIAGIPGPFGCPSPHRPASLVPAAVLEPGFHGVSTHWIRGFMAFRLTGAAAAGGRGVARGFHGDERD